jgi:hypothetical protein
VLLIGVLLLLAGGCCKGEPKAWNIHVSLDQDTWQRAYAGQQVPPYRFEVDLIGVSASEKAQLENYPVGSYFTPGDQRRLDADRVTLSWDPGQSQPKTLPKAHEAWARWKGATHLVVMANLQGVQVAPGAADPRRVVLPLACDAWEAVKETVEIVVKSSTIVNATEPKTPSKPWLGG